MTEATWQGLPAALAEDAALTAAVLRIQAEILAGPLARESMINRRLAIQQRALRRIEDWRVLLVLTPWMLSRLLFPDAPPALAVPPGWSADERAEADFLLLGPRLRFDLLGQPQQGHLAYHTGLGHYLLQPICLDMQPYADAEAVFAQWNQVIRTRDDNMEKAKRDCPLQQEVSRREFFRGLRGRPGDD